MDSKKSTRKTKDATPKKEKPIRNRPGKRKRKLSESNSEKFSDEQNFNPTDKTDLNGISLEDDHGKFKKYNKDKQWKLDQIPHHLLPSFNFTVDTDINNVRDYPLLKISLPFSVFVSSSQVNDVDICHRRTTALAAYMHHLKKLRTAYLSAKKKCKQIRKDEASGIYYHTFVTFAEMRDRNPDKYFARDYDFYYTSGNLCSNENTNQILHVSGPHLQKLILSRFSAEPEAPNVEKIAEFDFIDGSKENSEIFEVQFSESDNNSFYSRQKFSIALHQYTDDTIFTVKNFKSRKVPFISFAQDKFNKNHLSISTLQHQLRLYDLESDKMLQDFQLVPKDEIKPALTWNIVRPWTSQVYIYVSCKKINIIDTRVPQIEWQSNYCGYTEDNYCSNFCSLSLSGFDNLFYVASNHKLYCVDKRSMGKNIESKSTAVARWTHQMSSFPLMLATSRNNDCEYIALQSPLSSDLRICENLQCSAEYEFTTEPLTELSSKYIYKAPCLPYMPMSLESVFQEARKLGKCIKPSSGISNRIKSCCTGLSFVGPSSNPYIFTATTRGDIFARQMYSSNIKDLNEVNQISPADAMCRYEENIFRSVRKPPLQVTDICDLSGISKVFRCQELSGIRPLEDDLGIPSKRKYMGRWQKSVQSLFKYKDALAADLLSVWDVEEEDEKDFSFETLTKSKENDSNSVVRGWLTNAHDVPHSTMLSMTSIPSDVFMLSNAGLETLLEGTMKNEPQDEQPELLATPKLKVAKKKSRYIKGF